MRFLIDESLSSAMARGLVESGHDAVHVDDLGLAQGEDSAILESARKDNRIVVTQDTDFGTLLATQTLAIPSVILFRVQETSPSALTQRLLFCFGSVEDALRKGAIVVIDDIAIRIRRLPIGRKED